MTIKTIGPCTLYLGDARDILPTLEDVDHTIMDPPYEDNMHNAKAGSRGIRTDGQKNLKALNFESITKIRPVVTPMITRITKGWFLAFCTAEGVAPWRDAIEDSTAYSGKPTKYKRACVWVKKGNAPQFNGQGPAFGAEDFVTAWCGHVVSRWNGGGRTNVFEHPVNPPSRDGRHPTEKPLSLMIELITLFTNPGDLILDAFMGSGTTLLAAAMTGRRAIGIDNSEEYFDIACERLSADLLVSGGVQTPITVKDKQNRLFEY